MPAPTPDDPLYAALTSPTWRGAVEALIAGESGPVDFSLEALEDAAAVVPSSVTGAEYGTRQAPPPRDPDQGARHAHLTETILATLRAEDQTRHDSARDMMQTLAHYVSSEGVLEAISRALMSSPVYANQFEGNEFENSLRSAWSNAERTRDARRERDIGEVIGRPAPPEIARDESGLIQVPRLVEFGKVRTATEHHLFPVVQCFVGNIVAGPGGSHKTGFGVLLALATAAERPDLFWDNPAASEEDKPLVLQRFGPVLVLDLDGEPGAWEARLDACMALHKIAPQELVHPIHIYDPRRVDNQFALVEQTTSFPTKVVKGSEYDKLCRWIESSGVKFALGIVDTLGRAHPFPMVDEVAIRAAIFHLDRLADVFSMAVVVISHTSADLQDTDDLAQRKRKGVSAGSSAIENTSRSNSGMFAMGAKDAERRSILPERARNLYGVTVRKANATGEGEFYWFEKHLVELVTRKRDGSTSTQSVVALQRAYNVGVELPPSKPATPAIDPTEAHKRFLAWIVRALMGQGRMSVTACADRYIEKTPHNWRVGQARQTIRERLSALPKNTAVDMGQEGSWWIHVEQVTAKRKEIWADTDENMI